jgi:hypothetical protein
MVSDAQTATNFTDETERNKGQRSRTKKTAGSVRDGQIFILFCELCSYCSHGNSDSLSVLNPWTMETIMVKFLLSQIL